MLQTGAGGRIGPGIIARRSNVNDIGRRRTNRSGPGQPRFQLPDVAHNNNNSELLGRPNGLRTQRLQNDTIRPCGPCGRRRPIVGPIVEPIERLRPLTPNPIPLPPMQKNEPLECLQNNGPVEIDRAGNVRVASGCFIDFGGIGPNTLPRHQQWPGSNGPNPANGRGRNDIGGIAESNLIRPIRVPAQHETE